MSVTHPWPSCHARTRGNTRGEASKKGRDALRHTLNARLLFFENVMTTINLETVACNKERLQRGHGGVREAI